MPARIILDPGLGGRVINRIQWKLGLKRETLANMIGVSEGHLSGVANGKVPMEFGEALGLAAKTGDFSVVFDAELAPYGYCLRRLEEEEASVDFHADLDDVASPLAKTLAQLLDARSPGGDGGADITDAELQELGPHFLRLQSLCNRIQRGFEARGNAPAGRSMKQPFACWLFDQAPRGDNVGEVSRYLFGPLVGYQRVDLEGAPTALGDWHELLTWAQVAYRDYGAMRRRNLGIALNRAFGEWRRWLNGQEPLPYGLRNVA